MNGGELRLPDRTALQQLFFDAHDKAYGFHNAEAPIEIVNVRLSAGSALGRVQMKVASNGHADPRPTGRQKVYFSQDDCRDTPIYDRATFRPGLSFEGPAIVSQFDSTTVVFPGDRVTVDDSLSLIIQVQP
jgi:N-methylhydantoinase A